MNRAKQISAFNKGTLPKDEVEEFLEWYYSKEGEIFMASMLEEKWKEEVTSGNEKKDQETLDKEAVFRKIQARKENPSLSSKSKKQESSPQGNWGFKIAASLAIIFSLSFLYFQYFWTKGPDINGLEAMAMEIKSNPAGQKSKIKLSDGTIVYLNAASKLEYPTDFASNRQVTLQGEAFFEVFPDKDHPFTVKSNGMTTTALGTAFNIKAYKDLSETEVALTHGKVRVEVNDGEQQMELVPGEAALSNNEEGDFRKEKVDIEEVLYWKEGILHFDDTPFYEVVLTLERWYNVRIQLKGDYDGDFQCSGTFDKNEYLDNVLNILGHSIGFEYQINKQKVTINFHPN